MDKKACIWLFDNLTRYQFSTIEAANLRDLMYKTAKEGLMTQTDELTEEAQDCYESFVEMFYNNIYGYQNGLVSKPISSPELDCYFIETTDGILPIGYYKNIRPAETVLIVQKYLEVCTENINTEKNRIAIEWQRKVNEVSINFETVRTSGSPSMKKAVLGIVSSLMLFTVCIISFIKIKLFDVILFSENSEITQRIISRTPFNKSGDISIWTAYFVFVCVCILIAFIGVICTVMEFKSLKEKKNTEELLANVSGYINGLDGGVNFAVTNGTEMIESAIRKGENVVIVPNNNSMFIANVNARIMDASDFTLKTNFQRSGVLYAFVAVVFVLFVLLTLTNISAVSNAFGNTLSSTSSIQTGNDPDNYESDVNKPKISSYDVRKENVSWTQAQSNAQLEGGNLISINSPDEFEKACDMAEQAGISVCWVGSRINRGESWTNAKSLDGEDLYVAGWFSRDGVQEPTYVDALGNEELYLMIFKVDGRWYYNDAADDAIAASQNMYRGKIGYIIEIEE